MPSREGQADGLRVYTAYFKLVIISHTHTQYLDFENIIGVHVWISAACNKTE